jgi:hypothetical protein
MFSIFINKMQSIGYQKKVSYLEAAPTSLVDVLKKELELVLKKFHTQLHIKEKKKHLHGPILNFNPVIFRKNLEIFTTHCSI